LVPAALLGPPVVGVIVMIIFGGGLRETAAYVFGIMIVYPAALFALCVVLAKAAVPGGARMTVGLLAAGGSLLWWLVMMVGSIAP
jgi:hypothetical protein